MRRYGEVSKDQEPSLPHQFCSDCIIATGGYDFRKGPGELVFWVRSREIGKDGSNYGRPVMRDTLRFGSELKTQWPFGGLHLSRTVLRRTGASRYRRR